MDDSFQIADTPDAHAHAGATDLLVPLSSAIAALADRLGEDALVISGTGEVILSTTGAQDPVVGTFWHRDWPAESHDLFRHAAGAAASGQPLSFEASRPGATSPVTWWRIDLEPLLVGTPESGMSLALMRDITTEVRLRSQKPRPAV